VNNVQILPAWLAIMREEAERAAGQWSKSRRRGMFQADDFESVANEAVVEVLGKFDPDADPVRFTAMLRMCVRRRIFDYVRVESGGRSPNRIVPHGQHETPDGELIALVDQSADDPAGRAEVRELAASLPSPAEVRVKALALKAAVLSAIGPDTLTRIIRKQAEKAEAGDTKSARLILQVIGVNVASVDATDL
jgi:hypothetical protein